MSHEPKFFKSDASRSFPDISFSAIASTCGPCSVSPIPSTCTAHNFPYTSTCGGRPTTKSRSDTPSPAFTIVAITVSSDSVCADPGVVPGPSGRPSVAMFGRIFGAGWLAVLGGVESVWFCMLMNPTLNTLRATAPAPAPTFTTGAGEKTHRPDRTLN